MTTHRDLDQSDVHADAWNMMQKEMEDWAEHLDGADLVAIFEVLADEQELDFRAFCETPLALNLIRTTQSNPERAAYALDQIGALINAHADR